MKHPDIGTQLSEQDKIARGFMSVILNSKTTTDIRREAVNGLCNYTHIPDVIDILIRIMKDRRYDKETRLIATAGLTDHTFPVINIDEDGSETRETDEDEEESEY